MDALHVVVQCAQGFEFLVQHVAHRHTDAPFAAGNAGNDGVQVFSRSLDVLHARSFGQQFADLQSIGGVPLVGNGHRDDAQALEVVHQITTSGSEGQHLDYACLGAVVAVLGPAFAVREPYGIAYLGEYVADVSRQFLGKNQRFTRGEVAAHDEVFVDAGDRQQVFVGDEVVPDGALCQGHALDVKTVVEDDRVHDDVPVVGQEEIAFVLVQCAQPAEGDSFGGLIQQALYGRVDGFLDKIAHGGARSDPCLELFRREVRQTVPDHLFQVGNADGFREGGDGFLVGKRAYVVESLVVCSHVRVQVSVCFVRKNRNLTGRR